MNEIISLSAVQQAKMIRERKISAVELMEGHLECIAAVNPSLNAAVEVLSDRARADARVANRSAAVGPLHGYRSA